jgi:hypothetical protein
VNGGPVVRLDVSSCTVLAHCSVCGWRRLYLIEDRALAVAAKRSHTRLEAASRSREAYHAEPSPADSLRADLAAVLAEADGALDVAAILDALAERGAVPSSQAARRALAVLVAAGEAVVDGQSRARRWSVPGRMLSLDDVVRRVFAERGTVPMSWADLVAAVEDAGLTVSTPRALKKRLLQLVESGAVLAEGEARGRRYRARNEHE